MGLDEFVEHVKLGNGPFHYIRRELEKFSSSAEWLAKLHESVAQFQAMAAESLAAAANAKVEVGRLVLENRDLAELLRKAIATPPAGTDEMTLDEALVVLVQAHIDENEKPSWGVQIPSTCPIFLSHTLIEAWAVVRQHVLDARASMRPDVSREV